MQRLRKTSVVFHVGAHKTGTSLLQNYMRDHTWMLRRHRLFYIRRGAMNDYVGWGDKLLDNPAPLAQRIDQILRIPWFNVVVMSHENTLGRPLTAGGAHLYPRAPGIIDALGRLLRPYRAKIFFSIRPQEQFVESYYLQLIHQGGHSTFQHWLESIDLEALSWRPVVDALRHEFGDGNVEVIDFRDIQRGQEAYIRAFFHRIDPRYRFEIDFPSVRNASVSEKGLRLALAANPHLRSGSERRLMRRFLQQNFSNVSFPRPQLLTDEQKGWLQRRYGAEYEALVGSQSTTAMANTAAT